MTPSKLIISVYQNVSGDGEEKNRKKEMISHRIGEDIFVFVFWRRYLQHLRKSKQ